MLGDVPEGVQLTPLSRAVFDTMREYTMFPWEILTTQCERVEANAAALNTTQLIGLIDALSAAVARFTSPEKGSQLKYALRHLV